MLALPLVRPKSQLLTSSVMAARDAMGEPLMPTAKGDCEGLTWGDVVGARTEGEPFYEIRRYDFFEPTSSSPLPSPSPSDNSDNVGTSSTYINKRGSTLCLSIPVACFDQLPLCDAVGLLSGDDQTGLMVWEGSVLLTQWLLYAVMHNNSATANYSSEGESKNTKVIELGAGCGVVSAALARMLRVFSPVSLYDTVYTQIKGDCANVKTESDDRTTIEASTTTIIATDKNDECVYLCARNLRLEERIIARDVPTDGRDRSMTYLVLSSADTYDWGASVDDARRLVYGKGATEGDINKNTKLVVMAGDVIYCREAVPPLVQAIQHLGEVATNPSTSTTTPVLFILSWMPRSMTVGETIYLLSLLLSSAVSPTTDTTIPSPPSARVSLVYGAVLKDAPWEVADRTLLPPTALQVIIQDELDAMVEDARGFAPTCGANKETSSTAAETLLGRCATKGCVLGFTIARI